MLELFVGKDAPECGGGIMKRKKALLYLLSAVFVLLLVSCATTIPETYEVVYELKGGSWPAGSNVPKKYTSRDADILVPNPTKKGYSFDGWDVKESEGTQIATKNKAYVIDTAHIGNLILTANWKLITYSISYDETIDYKKDPEPIIEIPQGPIYVYSYTIEDANFNLPTPLDKPGLDFVGWKEKTDKKDPNIRYLVVTSNAKDYTFEAVWRYHSFEIAYELNGGNWSDVNPRSSFMIIDDNFEIPTPSQKDCDFIGWRIMGSDDEPERDYVFDTSVCQDVVLEAVWGAHLYQIKLNATGGSLKKDKLNYSTLDEPFLLPVPSKDNYTFVGWIEEGSDNSPVADYLLDTSRGRNLSFVAVWEPTVFHVKYDLAGGYLPYDVENPSTYTVETDTFNLVSPVKENYEFLGWIVSGDKNLELHSTYTVSKGSVGDIKLYAIFQWKNVELGQVTTLQQMTPVWGKGNIPRPDWVVKVPEDDLYHYEKGYAKGSSFYESIQMAVKEALLSIAEWAGVDTYEYFNAESREIENSVTTDVRTSIFGREIVEYWEDAYGGVWALVRIALNQESTPVDSTATVDILPVSEPEVPDTDLCIDIGELVDRFLEYII